LVLSRLYRRDFGVASGGSSLLRAKRAHACAKRFNER
jgi:hypothetical protein